MAKNRLSHAFDVEYHDVPYIEVLHIARDYVHKGHVLRTHPLSGSVKPNETPYKSVVISKSPGALDFKSLSIIEESIACYGKFDKLRNIPQSAMQDFMEIDLSLIESANILRR